MAAHQRKQLLRLEQPLLDEDRAQPSPRAADQLLALGVLLARDLALAQQQLGEAILRLVGAGEHRLAFLEVHRLVHAIVREV